MTENVNADFSKRVVMHGDSLPWEESPMKGVHRRRLDKVNGTNERVTTIVRYAPGSKFSSHVHGGGEEFVVLDGVFEDDYGQWPVGSYIRNPPGSSHTPGSEPGCTILVKLWQFGPTDRTFIHANINKIGAISPEGRPGVKVSPLYKDAHEEVCIESWAANQAITLHASGGAEVFVLDGSFIEGPDTLSKHSWLRVPTGTTINANAGSEGAKVWIKTGHLLGMS